jgi:hypothetical protein
MYSDDKDGSGTAANAVPRRSESNSGAGRTMNKSVARVRRCKPGNAEVDGTEILRLVFEKRGPAVIFDKSAEEMLRGPNGLAMRQIILDTIKAVLDNITVN